MEHHTLNGHIERKSNASDRIYKLSVQLFPFGVLALVKHDISVAKYGIFNKILVNDLLCNNYEILLNHQDKPTFIPNSANFLEILQIVHSLE